MHNSYNPYNMYISYNNAIDNVSHNTGYSVEEKHKKTEKLLKLGIALLLGGI